MMFDSSKPVKTRMGKPARIIATDVKSDWSIVALVITDNREVVMQFHSDGRLYRGIDTIHDLVNIVEYKYQYFVVTRTEIKIGEIGDLDESLEEDILAARHYGVLKFIFQNDKLIGNKWLSGVEYKRLLDLHSSVSYYGSPAQIIHIKEQGDYPVIALVGEKQNPSEFALDGTPGEITNYHLVNQTKIVKKYQIVLRDSVIIGSMGEEIVWSELDKLDKNNVIGLIVMHFDNEHLLKVSFVDLNDRGK
jgi:hypothetical protein